MWMVCTVFPKLKVIENTNLKGRISVWALYLKSTQILVLYEVVGDSFGSSICSYWQSVPFNNDTQNMLENIFC